MRDKQDIQKEVRKNERTAGEGQTGLVFFPAFDWAISPTHPEREERLLYTRDQLFEEGIMDLPQIRQYQPRLAELKDIARVHFCVPDVETQATEAHRIAAGGALVIADALMSGEIKNGFALVRPPGHHAMRVVHGNRGFCNINNEPVMIEYLRKKYGLQRIAIVDTDVHHGDGTQDIYWHDPDVLFISFHQDGRTLYPGSGFTDEIGGPLAAGATLNVPLPPGTTDEGILYVLDNLVLPVLDEFQPELIVNSAGQDNHYSDPLANMAFSARGYALLNEKLSPDIAVLEGGYSVETALPYVNLGIIMAMAGIDYSNLYEPDYRKDIFKEERGNLKRLEDIVHELTGIFRLRQELAEKTRRQGSGSLLQRHRQIYYDTDQIRETQLETLKVCAECPGYLLIESAAIARKGRHRVYCISIPIQCCLRCRQEARDHYAKMQRRNSNSFDYVYLQDRPADVYLQYDYRTKKERVF
ncbi:MAG TPA: histone deacetylase [Firmicutes bacterium]|jgi:acetoin utilization deacetylase AcuC-like enzyme|nr:histone deacetylase [Bacillota bacterium]